MFYVIDYRSEVVFQSDEESACERFIEENRDRYDNKDTYITFDH